MKQILLIGIVLFITKSTTAQPGYLRQPPPPMNSAETENAWNWADRYNKEILEAFAVNDLTKADYLLRQWDRTRGARNDNFWQRKAEYCLKIGKKSAAKRYYMKGYNAGCYECKDKADAILIDYWQE